MAFARTAVNTTGNTTSGSNQITGVVNTTGMFIDMVINGVGIPTNTLITNIVGTTITISNNATANGTGIGLTGQYITQSGTDADPSGLSAMTGVTTISQGSGGSLRKVYDLGNNQLLITGTLTHDPDFHEIIANVRYGLMYRTGSVVTYGVARTVNGKTTYSKGTGIVSTYVGDFFQLFGIAFQAGVFDWYGGVIKFSGAISHGGGSNFRTYSNDCVFQQHSVSGQFRSLGTPTFNGLTVQGVGVDFVFFLAGGWNNFSVNYERGYYQTPAGGGSNRTILNPQFANNQAYIDVVSNQASGTQQVTTIKNTDVFPRLGKLSNNSYADFPVVESLSMTISNSNNTLAQNVVAYIKDSDNGARKNSLVTNYINDRKYIATSNGSGIANLGDILTLVAIHNNLTDSTVNLDYRGNYGNSNADFDIYLGSYEHNPAVTKQSLIGNGGKSVAWTMFNDTNITLNRTNALAKLASSFTVDAATKTITVSANSGLEDLYDIAKAYKYNGTKENFETPAIDKLLVNANGLILTLAEDWDLVIETGVSLLKDTKFKEVVLTGTGLLTNNGTIDFPFTDSLGSRIAVFGLDPENFGVTWHLRYRKKAVGSTPAGAWINVSGTGNTTTILAEIASYDVMIRVPGYDWKTTEIDTNETLSLDVNLSYHVSANNTPQYTMSFNEDLEAVINFDYATNSVSIINTTGTIINPGFAEFYRATQRIQHIPALVWIWESPVTANSTSQKILIPTGNAISFFLTEDSNASVKATCPVIHQASGQSADDRVRGNSSGYSIILGSPATAESAGLQSAIVSDLLEKLGGSGYSVGTDSLKKIKDQLDLVKTKVDTIENYNDETLSGKVDAVKAVVDALENYNDAPTQDKLNSIKLAVDNLSNYNDTTLIAKVDAIKSVVDSIKTTVEDKTGYSLTTAQVEAIASTVEAHLLDEGDNQMLINAIVGAIGNANIDETALVAAIRADLERAGGKIDTIPTNPVLANDSRLNHLDADVSSRSTLTVQDIPEGLTVAEIEASTVLAKENTSQAIKTKVYTLDNADLSGLPTLAEIESSTVLAKEATLQELGTATTPATIKEELMPALTVINEGVKKASKIKTHKQNLP